MADARDRKQNLPRFMIAAPSSGSGKTLVTCGLLGLLQKNGIRTASFKCGPDFIDPMFHTKVLGTKSRNLDLFFTDPETTRSLLAENARGFDLAVMEGVMGYFDGIGLNSAKAGASDLASVTDTPVFLVVPAKGAGRSVLALIRGFLDFEEKSCIRGIILNRISGMLYPRMKAMIEKELHVPVVGYVPVLTDCVLESRHLGLMLPDEVSELKNKMDKLSATLAQTMDLQQILSIARSAPALSCVSLNSLLDEKGNSAAEKQIRIGLARDEAFCFLYEDNLQLLRDLGAEIVEFSPIRDAHLPDGIDGLLLPGGYPELYAEQLSKNTSMCRDVREKIENGLPTMAECGGFLYLHRTLEDMQGRKWPLAGVIPAKAWYTGKLTRFGYITLTGGTVFGRDVGPIRSHEFHYYDSELSGDAFLAEKPGNGRSWRCLHSRDTLLAGFPHLYYYANPELAKAFLDCCRKRTL